MAAQGYIGRSPGDSSNIIARQTYTPTGITTDFTFASTYSVGYIDVYLNGVRLVEGNDFTATDGSVVGLTTHAQNGDVIELVAYKTFNATNVTAANNDFSVAGNLSVTGVSTFTGAITATGGITGAVTGDATGLSGTPDITIRNLTGVAATFTGVLSYDDVTNVDSVGIITARSHVAIADSILHIGDTDTSIRFPAANTFTVETGGSERVRVSSTGKFGIGTNNPDDVLTVSGTDAFIKVDRSNGNPGIDFRYNGSTTNRGLIDVTSTGDLRLSAGGNTERVRIDSDGSVIIGDSDTDNANAIANDLVIGNTSQRSGITIVSGTGNDGNIFFSDGTGSAALRGQIVYNHTGDRFSFYTAASERLRVDSDGRVLLGTTSSVNAGSSASAMLQVEHAGGNVTGAFYCTADTTQGGTLVLGHGRGSATGVLQDDDTIGDIRFAGGDGTDLQTQGARIRAEVDGTPGSNDMPARLAFDTCSDGQSSPSEAMRIDSSQRLLVGATSAAIGSRMDVHNGSDTANIFGVTGADQSSEYLALGILSGQAVLSAGNASSNGTNLVIRTASSSGTETEVMRVDSSGRLLVNHTDDTAPNGYASKIQLCDTSYQGSSLSIRRDAASSSGPVLLFAKSRSTSKGGNTVIQNNDSIGALYFYGADGTDADTLAGEISLQVDGTPGGNDIPSRLVFATNSGSSDRTERMRIDSSGRLLIRGESALTSTSLTHPVQIAADSGAQNIVCYGRALDDISAIDFYEADTTTNLGEIQYRRDHVNFRHRVGDIRFATGGTTERARIDSSGRFLIGNELTSRTVGGINCHLHVEGNNANGSSLALVRNTNGATNPPYLMFGKSRSGSNGGNTAIQNGDLLGYISFNGADGNDLDGGAAAIQAKIDASPGSNDVPGRLEFLTTPDGNNSPSTRATIDRNGSFMIHTTSINSQNEGCYFNAGTHQQFHQVLCHTTSSSTLANLYINRQSSDGRMIEFRQADNTEGHISVSGTDVTLNGATLSRWSQPASGANFTGILRGSVLSNTNEMCEWTHAAQEPVFYSEGDDLPEGVSIGDVKTPAKAAYTEDNEQLNRMKISDLEGDIDVAGVFRDWDADEEFPDDFNVAMTGDFVIRIAQGTTVARGDLLMSAGDGTAKPQGDDIVRSKTIAKVTSTTVSTTYSDGSYCVPCVLMAC